VPALRYFGVELEGERVAFMMLGLPRWLVFFVDETAAVLT